MMNVKIFLDFLNEHKFHTNQIGILNYLFKISNNKTLIFTDTETTGLGGFKKQQLTQISSISYKYDFDNNTIEELGTFNKKIKISLDMRDRLFDPNDNIKNIFKFNRYGDKINQDPKYYDEIDVISEFKKWLLNYNNPILVMQNAQFDMNMLIGRGGDKINIEVLDTKQMIQFFIIPIVQKLSETDLYYKNILNKIGTSKRDHGLINSSMSKWGTFFNINMNGYHDALSDCRITSNMFLKMVEFIKNYNDINISKYQVERIKKK